MKSSLLKTFFLSVFIVSAINLSAQKSIKSYEDFKNLESTLVKTSQAKSVSKDYAVKSLNANQLTTSTVAAPVAVPVANYSYPLTTTALATAEDIFASYLSFNKVNNRNNRSASANDFDYIITPTDVPIVYFDKSKNSPLSFEWTIPGGTPSVLESQDAEVVYQTAGTYNFPTLKTTNADGDNSYTATAKLKVGGRGEISQVDFMEFNKTWAPGIYTWNNGGGFVTGSNTFDLNGFGNVIATGQESATVESVSVYIGANPTAADPNHAVRLTIYEMAVTDNGELIFDYEVLGTATLKVSDMLADASDVISPALHYVSDNSPVFGLANFVFDTPVEVPYLFFVAIDEIGNNVAGGDEFFIIMDELAAAPVPANWYAYNSYFYGETQAGDNYWFNLGENIFDGEIANPTLFIFPVINYGGETGIKAPASTAKPSVFPTGNSFNLTYSSDFRSVAVYDVTGKVISTYKLPATGSFSVPAATLNKGVYIFKFSGNTTESVKVIK